MKNIFFSILTVFVLSCSQSFAQCDIITTIAGQGGSTADSVPATTCSFVQIMGLAVDSNDNIYIADGMDPKLRKISNTGIITTIAGRGTAGYSGDGGPASAALLDDIIGVATNKLGDIFILNAYLVRKINAGGIITTIAGDRSYGWSGDGGPATAAQIGAGNIACDDSGNVYLGENSRVRKITNTGLIYTIAGNDTSGYSGDGGAATAAKLSTSAICVNTVGDIIVADYGHNVIRKINLAGIISTIAGTGYTGYTGDGGSATAATLNSPWAIASDRFNNIYISDMGNAAIRKIDTNGIISTIAGTGVTGSSGDGGMAIVAMINSPLGITVKSNLDVFFIECAQTIREVSYAAPAIAAITGADTMYVHNHITLSDSFGPGTWTSGNTAIASIDSSSGLVTGVSVGTAVITYSITNLCTRSTVFKTITVDANLEIDNTKNGDLEISFSPNPAHDNLKISFSSLNKFDVTKLQILDPTDKCVYDMNVEQVSGQLTVTNTYIGRRPVHFADFIC